MVNEQEKRIAKILGVEELEDMDDEALDYTEQNMREYLGYLIENVNHPCYLTGVMEFKWERSYDFSVKIIDAHNEYEDLKKEDQPSHTDIFELVSFEEIDPYEGIIVAVQRMSDKKSFILPLMDLKVTDKKSKNYGIIDDFLFWYKEF